MMDEVRRAFNLSNISISLNSIVEIPINGKFRLGTNPCKGKY
jgi:hypothetical protein